MLRKHITFLPYATITLRSRVEVARPSVGNDLILDDLICFLVLLIRSVIFCIYTIGIVGLVCDFLIE